MPRHRWLLFLAGLLFGAAGCSLPVHAVRQYLDAATREEAVSRLAPDYRLWFGERKGPGISRESAGEMLRWDYTLNVAHQIRSIASNDGVVTARVHEDNDFSRLIDFPGWDSTSTFLVGDDGRIVWQVYVPEPGQPEWRPYLDPALAWIREHRADALPTIFPDGKLARSEESARMWVRVLREWRAATGRPDRAIP